MTEAGTEGARDSSAPATAPRRRRRRWPWILLFTTILLAVGLRALLPLAVERGAAYGSRYWLGLPVRIDNADFDLFDGRLLLEGVSVGAAPDDVTPRDALLDPPPIDPATALFHLDRISAHLSWSDLRNHAIHVGELSLESPSVRVVREADGAIDPLRHARPLAPAAPEEPEASQPAEAPAEPWPLTVDTFALSAPHVVVADPAAGESLLDFSLEKFALDRIAVKGADVSLGGLQIEGPVLRVRRDLVLGPRSSNAGAANVAPAAAGESKPEAPPSPVASSPSAAASKPGYSIEKIDIHRATFTWVTDRGPLDVALTLHASSITADQGKHFPVNLEVEVSNGRLALAGEVGILPPSYTGKLSWSGLPFPPLLLASLPEFADWLQSADSTGDLTIDADVGGLRGPPTLHMSGRTTLETLAISDPGRKEVALGWKQLEVVMKDVLVPLPEQGKPPRTTVANLELVRLVEPKIHYTHPSPSLNALLGIRPAPAATEAPVAAKPSGEIAAAKAAPVVDQKGATPPPPPVDVTIGSLQLSGGDLDVNDTTVTPPVVSTVKNLEVSASAVHFPDPSASAIHVSAALPTSSTLTVDGDLRPGNQGDFTLKLEKLDLPTFSPYAVAAGASLDAGQASVTTKLKLRGTKMQVDNDLLLRKFGVSLRDPGSFDRNFGMPIDLALALLRDPYGNIRLKIPVAIGDKGAEVSMGAVIASALKAALLGAVTAPLKMLGAAFGGGDAAGGGLAIAPVGASAGSADLAPDAISRADGFAKLLADRPSMGLTLKGVTADSDTPVVAERILVEGLKAGNGLPDLEGSGFLARRRIGQAMLARDAAAAGKGAKVPVLSPEDQVLFDRYVAAVKVPDERLDALAKTRAEKLRDLLVARKVAAGRIEVGPREKGASPGVALSFRAYAGASH